MRTIFQKLYFAWTLFNFAWLMLICVPLIVLFIVLDEKKGGKIASLLLKFWGRGFCALSGIFYKTQGLEHLDPKQAYVFTANHRSFLDSPAMVAAIPSQFRALGKKEILDYPVFGFMFKYIGITVDRSSNMSRIRSLKEIREKLKRQMHILIFPEGLMNTTENTLLRFYDGAFRLAIETQSPIVPTAILNSRQILPRKNPVLRAGTIIIQFAQPIHTQGMTLSDVDNLKQQVRLEMERMILEFENTEKIDSELLETHSLPSEI